MVSDPTKDFNACEDFLLIVVSAHIIAATMKALRMKSMDEMPTANTAIGVKPEDVWTLEEEKWKKVLDAVCGDVVKQYVDFSFLQEVVPGNDGVCSYGKKVLGLGCFYMEFLDAIREGDSLRVLRCWHYLLPIFFATSRTNYCCEATCCIRR